jgi:hypothetical protein
VHQHIERVVGDVRLGRLEVLQKIEIWLSVGPHGHQLTIEHRVGGKIVERFGYVVELMICSFERYLAQNFSVIWRDTGSEVASQKSR